VGVPELPLFDIGGRKEKYLTIKVGWDVHRYLTISEGYRN